MNPADKREEVLFREALQKAIGLEREGFLNDVCKGDDALRARLEALLQATQGANPFPDPQVALPRKTIVVSMPLNEEAGEHIGHYKLLEQIGEGGMGTVWVAEQTRPIHREVALKVIKLGMDTKQVMARFEAERQALALMDHPNIAKVLDAGATETGRPYFVMERVKGIPLTHYCDQNKLSTSERLRLFVQVCHAIQHAHQKGIIHRDIKPSNILVALQDGVPVPKVIDFGIAKATGGQRLTELTLHTALAEFIGSPPYMSPEQAELTGVDIDTRSDIYSLGVLLYELLTGMTPFDAKRLGEAGVDGIRRIIREEEPPRPSTRLSALTTEEQTTTAKRRQTEAPQLVQLVRGDLDWIVMKALDKDRTRRYEMANALAMDVERYLRHEAILAHPPSSLYRLQKLLRRNRGPYMAVGAVSALAIALLLAAWSIKKEHAAKAALQKLVKANSDKSQGVVSAPAEIILLPPPWVDGEEMRFDVKVTGISQGSQRESVRADPTKAKNAWRFLELTQSGARSFALIEAEADTLKPIQSRRKISAGSTVIDVDATWAPGYAELRSGSKTEVRRIDLDGPVFEDREFYQLIRRLPLASGYKTTVTLLNTVSSIAVPLKLEVTGKETVTVPTGTYECFKIEVSNGSTFWYSSDRHRYFVKYFSGEAIGSATLELAAVRCLTLAESIKDLLKERTAETVDEAQYLAAGRSELLARVSQAREVLALEKEAADLAEKVKLAPAEEKYREALATSRKYWPTDPTTWENDVERLTRILAQEGKYDDAEKVFNETLAVEIGNPSLKTKLLEGRAYFLAGRARWKEAAADFFKLIEFQPDNHLYYHLLAPLLVESGDLQGYRRLCAGIIARFARTTDPPVCERMAKACLILPSSEIDLAAVAKMAQTAVSTSTKNIYLPFYEFAKGLAEYRAGNIASAEEWMLKVLTVHYSVRDVEAKLVLAMAQQRSSRTDDARAALAAATADLETNMPKPDGKYLGDDWNDWIIARALMKEAKALIEGQDSITK